MADLSQIKSRSIGQYIFSITFKKLGKTLGEGTFGKVKLATHILTGEKVAIKILEKQKIIDQSDVERVTREIQILKQVRHPHLVQLYEIIETPKQLFLVMEYINGGELFDYIVENTRIKDVEAARFYSQIISGIEYLHKLKIVHRDLKPENLLLEARGRLKIVDFGLSNLYKQDELLKTACGSPCYAAPEMIAGKKYNGLSVDIWSSGVILFAMLAGYLPFEDPNTSQLYKKILAGDYKFPKYISMEGRDLLKNILVTDPTKRFGIQDIRKHPWMNTYSVKVPQGLIMGLNQIPIDHDIIKQLQNNGISQEYAEKCIENNRHNHITTAYYLLLKKHIHNGGKSQADITSETFEPQIIFKKQLTTQEQDRKHIALPHPLPIIRKSNIIFNVGRQIHSSQANDESPDNRIRNQNYSINTQQNSIPQSPKLFNHSADVQRKPLDLQKTTVIQMDMNQTTYREYQPEVKVLKLKTPLSRNRVISDYYGRFPKRTNETRQKSIDTTELCSIRTFYRASPLMKR